MNPSAININDQVWFKLSEDGEAILNDYVATWNKDCPDNKITERQFRAKNWFYTMQLHKAMRIFGSYTYKNPFQDCTLFFSEPAQ